MAEVKRYTTPVFRVSFPAVFEASQYGEGEPKFGLTAVWEPAKFGPKDKKRWAAIKAALDAEAQERFKCAFKDLPGNVRRGLRDGREKADLEGFGEGKTFANITSKMRPGVVSLEKDGAGEYIKIGPEHGNADQIYPGCYARATVTVYSYDNKGKGVAIGLMNVQKVADGSRLDSRTDASEDFEDDVDEGWLEQDDSGLDDEIPF